MIIRPCGPEPVMRWSAAALAALVEQHEVLAFRGFAIVHGAILDAVSGTKAAAREASVAAGAREALATLVPERHALIGAAWTESAARFDGDAFSKTIDVARKAAALHVARHAWANGENREIGDSWMRATPFLLEDWDRFRREHSWSPPRQREATEVHEVSRLGGRKSLERTADETAAAIFWSGSPVLIWGEAACAAVEGHQLDLLSGARALALVAMAMADAQIVAWRLKRLHASPLPGSAIRGEVPSRIAPRSHEAQWTSLLGCRESSEYPCASCIAAGAAVGVLRVLLGDDAVKVSITSPREVGLTRSFGSLSEMLQESEDARVWGGLHYRSSAVESTELGLRLGEAFARLP